MLRKIIKFVLIFIVLIIGTTLFNVAKYSGAGALPMAIISIAMFSAIGAIWKYNPSTKEISLNKDK